MHTCFHLFQKKKNKEIGIFHDELILFFQKVWTETYVFSLIQLFVYSG